jgi:hypothetical protein
VTGERERLEREYAGLLKEAPQLGNLVSYAGNKHLPILRLYRFKEAFSLPFVNYWLDSFRVTSGDIVLAPFAGMGTTLFGSMLRGISSIGIERLPIAAFVARTLPRFLWLRPGQLWESFEELKMRVDGMPPAEAAVDVNLMKVGFDPHVLHRLRQWKAAIDQAAKVVRGPLLLLFYASLYDCSYGRNDGQFVRIRRDKKPLHPDEALERRVRMAEEDILRARVIYQVARPGRFMVLEDDARQLASHSLQASIVITSPPYLNRYDYTRSYCFELCMGFVRNFQELRALRHSLLRSHIESRVDDHESPRIPALQEVLDSLAQKRLNNPKVPDMIRGYFADMSATVRGLAAVVVPGGRVAMVVDNVRFEGEVIPVDLLLCQLAEQVGFTTEQILVCRLKGNSSQQMRRYGRMPVRESVVVWRRL